jgi:hypothetical protein
MWLRCVEYAKAKQPRKCKTFSRFAASPNVYIEIYALKCEHLSHIFLCSRLALHKKVWQIRRGE